MTLSEHFHQTYAPDKKLIDVPKNIDYHQDIYRQLTSLKDYQTYYQDQGYVIARNLIQPQLCDDLKQVFQTLIKPYQGYLYRQVTANPEKHHLSPQGWMLNALLNVQDLDNSKFKEFKELAFKVFTDSNLIEIVKKLLDESGILIQSMFFEGNSATWPHQDTYYLDANKLGRMLGIWVALEDINATAGRFFIYPKSHQLSPICHQNDLSIADAHQNYKQKIIEMIKTSQLTCYAPCLKKGDVLFWNSYTIHGSLKTDNPNYSRYSLTGHYIPESSQLLQYHKRIIPLDIEVINNVKIHHPKNLARWDRKLIFQLEIYFPHLIQTLKKKAIQHLIK